MTRPLYLQEYPRLCSLLTWLLDGPPVGLGPGDLARVRAHADQTGIRAIVEHFLLHRGIDGEPGPTQRLQRTRYALMRHHLRELSEHLDVPFILLKGEALGRRIFGVGSVRSSGDIDILVRPEAVASVIELAGSLGYVADEPGEPQIYENNQFPLVHRDSGVLLEVHWSLDLPRVPTPDVDACFAHAGYFDDALDVLVFDDAFRVLQASYHLYHHAGFLKGMVDCCALFDVVDDAAVAQARRIAGRVGVRGMVDWGLATSWLLSPVEPRRWSRANALLMAIGWTWRARGVLRAEEPISGAGLLGWKAGTEERAPRALWGIAMAGLLDRPSARLDLLSRTVLKDRRTLAAEIGRAPTWLDTGRQAVARPIELIRKTASDLIEGG